MYTRGYVFSKAQPGPQTSTRGTEIVAVPPHPGRLDCIREVAGGLAIVRQESPLSFDQRVGLFSRSQDDPAFLDLQVEERPRCQVEVLPYGQGNDDPTGGVDLESLVHAIADTICHL
jgi:hypothetical protein